MLISEGPALNLWQKYVVMICEKQLKYDDGDRDDGASKEEYSTEYIFHSSCIWSHTDNS